MQLSAGSGSQQAGPPGPPSRAWAAAAAAERGLLRTRLQASQSSSVSLCLWASPHSFKCPHNDMRLAHVYTRLSSGRADVRPPELISHIQGDTWGRNMASAQDVTRGRR